MGHTEDQHTVKNKTAYVKCCSSEYPFYKMVIKSRNLNKTGFQFWYHFLNTKDITSDTINHMDFINNEVNSKISFIGKNPAGNIFMESIILEKNQSYNDIRDSECFYNDLFHRYVDNYKRYNMSLEDIECEFINIYTNPIDTFKVNYSNHDEEDIEPPFYSNIQIQPIGYVKFNNVKIDSNINTIYAFENYKSFFKHKIDKNIVVIYQFNKIDNIPNENYCNDTMYDGVIIKKYPKRKNIRGKNKPKYKKKTNPMLRELVCENGIVKTKVLRANFDLHEDFMISSKKDCYFFNSNKKEPYSIPLEIIADSVSDSDTYSFSDSGSDSDSDTNTNTDSVSSEIITDIIDIPIIYREKLSIKYQFKLNELITDNNIIISMINQAYQKGTGVYELLKNTKYIKITKGIHKSFYEVESHFNLCLKYFDKSYSPTLHIYINSDFEIIYFTEITKNIL
jgi:hypothetical protein